MTTDRPLIGISLMLGFCIVAPFGDAADYFGPVGLAIAQTIADTRRCIVADRIAHIAAYRRDRSHVHGAEIPAFGRCRGYRVCHAILHADPG